MFDYGFKILCYISSISFGSVTSQYIPLRLTYYPLFRVRSWNNGMRCMFLYILIILLYCALGQALTLGTGDEGQSGHGGNQNIGKPTVVKSFRTTIKQVSPLCLRWINYCSIFVFRAHHQVLTSYRYGQGSNNYVTKLKSQNIQHSFNFSLDMNGSS